MDSGEAPPPCWSRSPSVLAMLDTILDGKAAELVEGDSPIPDGGLQDEHVHQLVDLIVERRKRKRFSVDYALYVMLYHLLGGADAKLLVPPAKANEFVNAFGLYIREARLAFKGRLETLKKEAKRASPDEQRRHADGIQQQMELARGTGLLDQLVCRLRGSHQPAATVAVALAAVAAVAATPRLIRQRRSVPSVAPLLHGSLPAERTRVVGASAHFASSAADTPICFASSPTPPLSITRRGYRDRSRPRCGTCVS